MAGAGFWERFLDMLFGESARPEGDRPLLGAPMLSNWLPYRSYDAKSGLFINTESLGFVLELAPMMGADERRPPPARKIEGFMHAVSFQAIS